MAHVSDCTAIFLSVSFIENISRETRCAQEDKLRKHSTLVKRKMNKHIILYPPIGISIPPMALHLKKMPLIAMTIPDDPVEQKTKSRKLEQCQQFIYLAPDKFQFAFDQLKQLLSDYKEHCTCSDVAAQAFSILIVLAGKRDAMSLQTSFDPRDLENPEYRESGLSNQTSARELGKKIQILINDTLQLSDFRVLEQFEGHSFQIYSSKIQNEVDVQIATNARPCCHLRYLYPYEPERFTCSALFSMNEKWIYGFGCFEITTADMLELGRRLALYKEVAAHLENCKVQMVLKFDSFPTFESV